MILIGNVIRRCVHWRWWKASIEPYSPSCKRTCPEESALSVPFYRLISDKYVWLMNELKFGLHSGPTRQCICIWRCQRRERRVQRDLRELPESFDEGSEHRERLSGCSEGSIKTNLTGKERNFLSPDVHTTFCVEVHQGKRLYR